MLSDHLDVKETDVGPTRSGHQIDCIFTNFEDSIVDRGTVPPLETDDQTAKLSDYRIAFAKSVIPRTVPVKWLTYSYWYYNPDSATMFGGWLAHKRWDDLTMAATSSEKAEIYQREVVGAMEACFPLITVKRKASDPPWINGAIRKKLNQRKGIYRREGRSSKWKSCLLYTSPSPRDS